MNGQQNQTILNTLKKFLAFVVICIVVLSMSLSVFAASDYNRDDMVTISGQTDFDSQYTWNAPYNIIDGRLTYECFTILAEDGTKWYVAVNPRQMQYYQNAFYGKSLVLKGKYKGNIYKLTIFLRIVPTSKRLQAYKKLTKVTVSVNGI